MGLGHLWNGPKGQSKASSDKPIKRMPVPCDSQFSSSTSRKYLLNIAFGVAEPCSRLRKFGGALFERSEFAPTPKSANRAGNPKGHARANMVLGPFAETKGPRMPGRNPVHCKNFFCLLPISSSGNIHLDKNSDRFRYKPRKLSLPKNLAVQL